MNLKIALGMIAGGANLRRFGAHHDVSAVPAFPNLHFALFKHFLALHIVQKDSVALFMMLFNSSNQPKTLGKLGKALFLCGLGKFLVHIGPFVVFSLCGRKQILCRIADARKLLEPELGVFLLVFGGFQEKRRNLLIALLLAWDSPANAACKFFSVCVPVYLFFFSILSFPFILGPGLLR